MSEILIAREIHLSYGSSAAVKGASIAVRRGEIAAITGPSGSGKSSLLYCLAGVLPVSAGEVRFEGRKLGELGDDELSSLRRDRFGFVFQYGELLPELTVEENAALPLRLAGQRKKEALATAGEVLGRLGLSEVRERRPAQVSGGQSQRAAVARALVHRPTVVFADEPTGSLDSVSAHTVLEEFLTLARSQGSAVVLVTHDTEVADRADTRYRMVDGVLTGQDRAAR
ncbi:ABC transporter ATP-binding protein [Streptomyces sp. NPDC127190]|uniref:ABC transporter ATP-binding protein n=1 Tax=unclassified Streptomyces TaxID=2593676 RepID=UPI00362CBA21